MKVKEKLKVLDITGNDITLYRAVFIKLRDEMQYDTSGERIFLTVDDAVQSAIFNSTDEIKSICVKFIGDESDMNLNGAEALDLMQFIDISVICITVAKSSIADDLELCVGDDSIILDANIVKYSLALEEYKFEMLSVTLNDDGKISSTKFTLKAIDTTK